MDVKIPKEYISGFGSLNKLELDQIREVSKFLKTVPSGTGPQEFDNLVKKRFPDTISNSLSATIYSLGSILLNFEESIENVSKMLASSLKKEIADIDEVKVEEKINIILTHSENLKYTFKASNLLSDNDLTFSKGKIISDVRILFKDDINDNQPNRKAVIIHKLKIEAIQNNNLENFYFSMDSNDLLKMKELVSRALNKDEKIRADYSNIDFIKITD